MRNNRTRVQYADIGGYACYSSRYYAASLSTTAPVMAHLGIESGGRTRRHMDFNLLKPGLGAVPSKWKHCEELSVSVSHDRGGVTYCRGKADAREKVEFFFGGERRMEIAVRFARQFTGNFFEFSFGNDVAPVTTWAVPVGFPIVSCVGPDEGPKRGGKITNRYRLPVLLHFPDYGFLKIECDRSEVICVEELVPLREMKGLSLGFMNKNFHNDMLAYHHGVVTIRFHAPRKLRSVSLKLTVEKEIYPRGRGCDFRGPRWAGLRRCWMNSFTLAKRTLTMGDNIALDGIAHLSMHFKSDLLLHTPQLPNGVRVQDFLRRALATSFEQCQAASGEINWEYRRNPGKKQEMAAFIDTTPSVLIAFRNSCRGAGNREFAQRYVGRAIRAARFLMARDVDGDGIVEVPFHGNRFEETTVRNRNWWDNFAFGHKDIYFNLLCRRALRSVLDLLRELGIEESRKEIEIFLARFDSNFKATFFNPKTGVYAGWISRDGKVHDYMFTFASAMAINEGLVPRRTAVRILRILLRQLGRAGFGDWRYGIPGPTIPVSPRDTIAWDFMGKWPRYENGGLCGQTAYHFIRALRVCGMKTEAHRILFAMLRTFENEPTHSGLMPGYMKSMDWRTRDGHTCGYNYLADNYYFLLAAMNEAMASASLR